MGQEIERKFLVVSDEWRAAQPVRYRQGYLCRKAQSTLRVRMTESATRRQAFFTVKGMMLGISRLEYEYEIPVDDAEAMLAVLCEGPLVEKDRRRVEYGGLVWEVDEFLGDNAGLILAEVELSAPDQAIELPPWVGSEVSHLPRYYNANLSVYPYTQWMEEERMMSDA
ncbi:MAG: CYTH domain-containing protein [Caldilineaceae bacterium]|nr:CYTH domain-containing protein [Caldilineaceae bacterium]MCB9140191.1 CYTH domain-containing protein [Caldilineaceae bacterium]